MALEQAAAYIYHTNIGSDQFIDLINKHELKLFDSNYAVGSYEKTIHTVWNITFDNLSNNAKALLHCFAYMSPNSVELGWIIEHAHNVKARRNGSNALKGFTVKSVFPSELILTCTDELILIKAKAELMAYSLATPKTNDSFIMNALLQEVIRYCLANDSKFAYLLSMWEVLQTQSENIDMIYNDYRIALSLSQAKPLMQNVRSFWKFRQELSRSLNNVSSHRVDMDLLHFEFQLYSFSAQFLTLNADTDEEIYEEADIYYSKACSLSQLLFGGGENDIVSSTQSFTTIQEKHRRMRVNLVLKRNDIAKKLYEEAKQVLINSARINPGMVKQALTNYSDLWSEFGFPDAADEARKIAVECGVAHGR